MVITKSSSAIIWHLLRELISIGYSDLRCYTYIRWNNNISVVYYSQRKFMAHDGSCVQRIPLIRFEYKPNLKPVWPGELDRWVGEDCRLPELAQRFRSEYLEDHDPNHGDIDECYMQWLNLVLKTMPPEAIAITEEPVPGGIYPAPTETTYYLPLEHPEQEKATSLKSPLPPGLRD